MPSHRDTARNGLSARSVRIERKAGISAMPANVAAKLIKESCKKRGARTSRTKRVSLSLSLYGYSLWATSWLVRKLFF